ncbi:hypothetical protein [Serratia liquefaciens]|uniref:Ead/Ea22-like family protein n=1 Tax=Serratia liquefaciens TaxID=614 RepID=A0A515CWC4_SERLI|nr:hypothetical protein [Serratia liquefaciens]QDL32410.1 hypothetical protein EGO53_11675 [Serratia liquefaciens]
MIKRFNPDFSLSISHELAYMRETPEGGYVAQGDYATLFSELEVVKAERDALERQLSMSEAKCKGYFSDAAAALVRCDALAVENAALKSISIKLFNLGYLHGHEFTVEGYFVDVHRNDLCTYHDDVVAEIIEDENETPATSAALAAIEARGVEKFADFLDSPIDGQHCYQNEVGLARHFASTLREAK